MDPNTRDPFQRQSHPSADPRETDTGDPLNSTAANTDSDPTDQSSGHSHSRKEDFRDIVRGIAIVASLIVALIVYEALLPATAC